MVLMKEKFKRFISNKFNIALIIIQVLAISSYFLNGTHMFFTVMFFLLEGAFFILWGIKMLINISDTRRQYEIYEQLPYEESEKIRMIKASENSNKHNKFMGIGLILLGIVLIFSLFSMIF